MIDRVKAHEIDRRKHEIVCAGIIASTIINQNPYRRRGSRAARSTDWLQGERERDVPPERTWSFLKVWAEMQRVRLRREKMQKGDLNRVRREKMR